MRMGTPRALASRAMSLTLSWYLMFPGLIRRPWIPFSSASMAYFHWKWMSATTGTVACSAICLSARASSQCGTATRTMSTPAATSRAICCSVALTSEVFVVVMDWIETGASPPTSTRPTLIFFDVRRSASMATVEYASEGEGDVARDHGVEAPAEVVEDAILPFVDQQRARRVGAEDHRAPVGDARVLDRPAKIVGEVDRVQPVGRPDLDRNGG